jgi:hypothetical protein
VGDARVLTKLSVDGEYTSDTLSEPRGSILRGSVTILIGRDPHREFPCLVTETCLQTLASTISSR